jgi:hypothetical protein
MRPQHLVTILRWERPHTTQEAALLLGLCDRQVRRLMVQLEDLDLVSRTPEGHVARYRLRER